MTAPSNSNENKPNQPTLSALASFGNVKEAPTKPSNTNGDAHAGAKRSASGQPQASANEVYNNSIKKSRNDAPVDNKKSDFVDAAKSLGHKDGDRFEVEWDVEEEDVTSDNGNEGEQGTRTSTVTTRWWPATLLPCDGRTKQTNEQKVAIRTLEYEPFPPHFMESSREDVIFLNHEVLENPETGEHLYYRPAGANSNDRGGEEFVVVEDNQVETLVDGILEGAMKKNQAAWSQMTAAQQAHIASKIAQKKTKLVSLLEEHATQTGVVTAQDVTRILAETMAG